MWRITPLRLDRRSSETSRTFLHFAGMRDKGKRGAAHLCTIKWLARPEGFEPPTKEVEAPCSIQLSYGRSPMRLARIVG